MLVGEFRAKCLTLLNAVRDNDEEIIVTKRGEASRGRCFGRPMTSSPRTTTSGTPTPTIHDAHCVVADAATISP